MSCNGEWRALPLENGDRLSRAEFERRYLAMPHVKKAELIEGVVHMPSPVSHVNHGRPHSRLMIWLGKYLIATPGVDIGDNATVRLDLDNEPQPDAALFVLPGRGGRVRFTPEGYIDGPPELVAEVSSSTASIDLNAKLNAYRRSGVQEYLVWRVRDAAIDWLALRDSGCEPLRPDGRGVVSSEAFPGLALDAPAMLRDDMAGVLAALRAAAGSPAHRALVARLAAATP